MSEEKVKPTLHPLYKPAVSDSILLVHFVGNTAVVANIGSAGDPGIDPYQMLGASEAIKRKGFQMLQMAEVAEAKARIAAEGPPTPDGKQIIVTDKMPPGSFKGTGVDHLKG